MLRSPVLSLAAAVLSLSLVTGCSGSDESAEEADAPGEALLAGNDMLSATSKAYEGRVEAPLHGNEVIPRSFDSGKRVIAGAPTLKNPSGYLRKITSYTIKGDTLVLQTVSASLEDAVKDGALRAPTAAEQLHANVLQAALQTVNIKPGGEKSFGPLNVLAIQAGTIRAEGSSFNMTPDVSLTASVRNSRLNRFELRVSGQLLAKAALQISGGGAKIGAEHEENFGIPVQIAVIPVFGVPVPV